MHQFRCEHLSKVGERLEKLRALDLRTRVRIYGCRRDIRVGEAFVMAEITKEFTMLGSILTKCLLCKVPLNEIEGLIKDAKKKLENLKIWFLFPILTYFQIEQLNTSIIVTLNYTLLKFIIPQLDTILRLATLLGGLLPCVPNLLFLRSSILNHYM